MRTTAILVPAAFLTLAVGAPGALAQNTAMPAGARQWIEGSANWHNGDVGGGVGSIPYPSPNYVNVASYQSINGTAYVNADSTANRMRSSYWVYHVLAATGGIFFYNSMNDTYTISGPAGTEGSAVDARVIFHGKGLLFVGEATTLAAIRYYGYSRMELEIGVFNPSTDPTFYEGSRVNQFDPTWYVQSGIPNQNYGPTPPPPLAADLVLDKVLTATVGQPFDIGFGFNVYGYGCGDTSGSPSPSDSEYAEATIEWILPEGYSMTSALGYTPFCAADYNKDGFVTGDDFDAFTADFDTGSIAADVNHDGFPNGDDFDFFTQHFDVGC